MAVIKQKRGTTVPTAADLVQGELAIKTDEGRLFTKKDDGSVAEIGASASASASETFVRFGWRTTYVAIKNSSNVTSVVRVSPGVYRITTSTNITNALILIDWHVMRTWSRAQAYDYPSSNSVIVRFIDNGMTQDPVDASVLIVGAV